MALIDRVLAPDSLFSKRFFFLAKRFVAGDRIETAMDAVRDLNERGMTATLDFLGEDVLDRGAAEQTRDAYLRMLDAIAQHGLRSNVSVKLTAMGLLIDEEFALQNVLQIAEYAKQHNPGDPFVRIDMEGSAVTDATLRVFESAFAQTKNVGPVLQAYLKRTPADVERMIDLQARVRLCKGAYNEPPHIAIKDMPSIRQQYMRLAQELLSKAPYPGMATHDRGLIELIKSYTRANNIAPSAFEFQMLYGVRPAVQEQIIAEGYNLRVYVPFGTHWAGYFYRRVMERRENLGLALTALFSR